MQMEQGHNYTEGVIAMQCNLENMWTTKFTFHLIAIKPKYILYSI